MFDDHQLAFNEACALANIARIRWEKKGEALRRLESERDGAIHELKGRFELQCHKGISASQFSIGRISAEIKYAYADVEKEHDKYLDARATRDKLLLALIQSHPEFINVKAERDELAAQCKNIKAERDELASQIGGIKAKRDELAAQIEIIRANSDALRFNAYTIDLTRTLKSRFDNTHISNTLGHLYAEAIDRLCNTMIAARTTVPNESESDMDDIPDLEEVLDETTTLKVSSETFDEPNESNKSDTDDKTTKPQVSAEEFDEVSNQFMHGGVTRRLWAILSNKNATIDDILRELDNAEQSNMRM